eukprot:maker-scaffold_46-snap-gene-1.95-mRNA-1 protein AED:0.03 eAED:0.03 QI:129/1/1/1/1/1/4/178/354
MKGLKKRLISQFPPSTDFSKTYDLVPKPVGTGHFSKVYQAQMNKAKASSSISQNTAGEVYAVKIIDLNKLQEQNEVQALEREISILKVLQHPGIVRLFSVYSNPQEVWLVQEMLRGGELFKRIIDRSEKDAYSEVEAAKIVKRLLSILNYLHKQKIVHRDIKPENILLKDENDDFSIKLADFGFAAYCEEPLNDPFGTPVYVAPEILVGEPYKTTPDCWSLGVITYILMTGYPPWFHTDQVKLAKLIVRKGFKFDPEDWKDVSSVCKDFIRGLLKKHPKKRMTAEQGLQHPWILNYTKTGTIAKHLTINTELKKFRAKANLVKAFGAMRVFYRLQKLAEITKELGDSVEETTDI